MHLSVPVRAPPKSHTPVQAARTIYRNGLASLAVMLGVDAAFRAQLVALRCRPEQSASRACGIRAVASGCAKARRPIEAQERIGGRFPSSPLQCGPAEVAGASLPRFANQDGAENSGSLFTTAAAFARSIERTDSVRPVAANCNRAQTDIQKAAPPKQWTFALGPNRRGIETRRHPTLTRRPADSRTTTVR